jgi:ubiquinone/menaquinone biosynthesis C-methylase UbiE
MKKRQWISFALVAVAGSAAVAGYRLLLAESDPEKRQVASIIAALQLAPGQRVADLGAGDGLFTLPMAREVSETGLVYAIEIKPGLLQKIERKAQAQGLKNVRTVLAVEDDPKLPEPVDLIVIIHTLHHINNRGAYLQTLRRYLKPGGRLAVIEPADDWPLFHGKLKYSVADLDGWMEGAGYRRVAQHDFVVKSFFVVYQLP